MCAALIFWFTSSRAHPQSQFLQPSSFAILQPSSFRPSKILGFDFSYSTPVKLGNRLTLVKLPNPSTPMKLSKSFDSSEVFVQLSSGSVLTSVRLRWLRTYFRFHLAVLSRPNRSRLPQALNDLSYLHMNVGSCSCSCSLEVHVSVLTLDLFSLPTVLCSQLVVLTSSSLGNLCHSYINIEFFRFHQVFVCFCGLHPQFFFLIFWGFFIYSFLCCLIPSLQYLLAALVAL